MKMWHWVALGVGVLVVLHFMANNVAASEPPNPLLIGSSGTGTWLRLNDPRFNFGLKL